MLRNLPLLLLLGCSGFPSPGPSQNPQKSVADVFEEVQSSVVTLVTSSRDVDPETKAGLTSVAGLGSGVLISKDGKILTAAHVVQTADLVYALFTDGTKRRVKILASDTRKDLALVQTVRTPPDSAHVAALADSDKTRVGDRIFVVGAPRGITHTLTVGHVSAKRKPEDQIKTLFDAELIQTDAAINQGNSGGPMFDMLGRVVGIVSHIVSASGGSEGLGFAISANVARRRMLESPPFWSGIESVVLTGALAEMFNLPEGRSGILVQRVARHSPAAKIGLRGGVIQAKIGDEELLLGGDVILSLGGIPMGKPDSYARARKLLIESKPGDKAVLEVLRAGTVQRVALPLRDPD